MPNSRIWECSFLAASTPSALRMGGFSFIVLKTLHKYLIEFAGLCRFARAILQTSVRFRNLAELALGRMKRSAFL